MTLFLIKRGPRPDHHNAPYHPVVIASLKRVAKWEAGWTGDAAWVWTHDASSSAGGWLLERWAGLDIDYGHVVRAGRLPDGTEMAFVHESTGREPWSLFAGAIWWGTKRMPTWLESRGCLYAPDAFSQQSILDTLANDGCSGFGREGPDWWPTPAPVVRHEIVSGRRIPVGTVVTYARVGEPPVRATVHGLFFETEAPNGRFGDRYDLTLENGQTASPMRVWLETANPDLVADGAA